MSSCETLWQQLEKAEVLAGHCEHSIRLAEKEGSKHFDQVSNYLQLLEDELVKTRELWETSFVTTSNGARVFGPNYDTWIAFCKTSGYEDEKWALGGYYVKVSEQGLVTDIDLVYWPEVTDLTLLAKFQGLQRLFMPHVKVKDLYPVGLMTSLTSLTIPEIVEDIAPLSRLKKLKNLYMQHGHVADLSPLRNLKSLTHIVASSNPIEDVEPLSGLINLEILDIRSTKVRDLSPLSKLTTLRSLTIEGTEVSDLSPLKDLSGLEVLEIGRTQVTDIRVLTEMTSLKVVIMDDIPALQMPGTQEVLKYLKAKGVGVNY